MLGSFFKRIAGKKTLEKADIEPVMNGFKDLLMTKNVAQVYYHFIHIAIQLYTNIRLT
jgi:hypothetical protein